MNQYWMRDKLRNLQSKEKAWNMQEKPHKRVGIYKEKIIININYIHTINISMLNHISIKRSLLQGKKKTKEKNKNKYKKK